MNEKRRTTILSLLTGLLAGLAILTAKRRTPVAGLATRLAKPIQPQVQVKTYGYAEVNLS